MTKHTYLSAVPPSSRVHRRPVVNPAAITEHNWTAFYFAHQVHHYGSFLEAAAHTGRAQGYLSQKIDALEKSLGFRLFNRRDRGVTLTRKGEEILRPTTPLFHAMRGAVRAGVRNEAGARHFRVVSTHAVMSYILLEPLMKFQEEHPGLVQFDFVGDDIHLDLERHDADLLIRPALENTSGLTQVPLFVLRKQLYASQNYLDKHGTPTCQEDLQKHKIISRPYNAKSQGYADTNWILRISSPEGMLRKPDFTSNTLECTIKKAELGLGIVASYDAFSLLRDSNLVKVLPDVVSELSTAHLVYSKNLVADKELSLIVNFLTNYFDPK